MKRASVCFAVLLILPVLAAPARAGAPLIDLRPIDFVPPEADRVVLSNGVVVYLVENHELPLFDLRIQFRATPADDVPDHASDLLSEVWRSGGTARRAPDALDEELESMAASVESSAGAESFSLSVSCLSREIPRALDIWADVLLHPAFNDAKLALAKGQALEGIRRRNETPNAVGRRLFRDVIYGRHHVYADDAQPEQIKRVARSALAAVHRRVVVPQEAFIAVAGDFDRKTLLAALEKEFASWKPSGQRNLEYDYAISSAPAGSVFLLDKGFSQSRVSIGRVGMSRHDPDRVTVAVADYILGGGGPSRLFGDIRSRRGLAYMVGSFIFNPAGPGMLGVVAQTKTESTVALIEAVLADMKEFSEKPVTDEELDLARSSLMNGYVFGFDSPMEIAEADLTREFYGYPEDELRSFPKKVKAVKASNILAVAKKFYRPEGVKIAVVGDAKKFDGSLDKFGPVTRVTLDELDK